MTVPARSPRRMGCPIRRPRDQRSLASPPGFSQRATSFIASQCQGIHQMPFSSPQTAPNNKNPKVQISAIRYRNRRLSPDTATISPEDTPADHRPRMPGIAPHPRPRPAASVTFNSSLHPVNQHTRGEIPREPKILMPSPTPMMKTPMMKTPYRSPPRWRRLVEVPGGGERDRTDDLLLAKQALSQLSYTPGFHKGASVIKWWAREDLNLRPHAYQARALTS